MTAHGNKARIVLRKIYEVIFIWIFAGTATLLIASTSSKFLQFSVILVVIFLTETGRTKRIMDYFGDKICHPA